MRHLVSLPLQAPGDGHRESRTLTRLAVHADRAPEQLEIPFYDGEPQTDPLARSGGLDLMKAVEYLRQVFGGDPQAGILDRQLHRFALREIPHPDIHLSFGSVLERVHDKVLEYGLHLEIGRAQ